MLHISCNIGTRDLPDMYALGLWAYISHKSLVPMLQLLHVYKLMLHGDKWHIAMCTSLILGLYFKALVRKVLINSLQFLVCSYIITFINKVLRLY